ncbi:MAG: T9SS type A sorting domain-containing protein [candidate division Zixibacteria bacterium]
MKSLILAMTILAALAFPVLAQVDTLQLLEFGRIDAPSEITNLYIEDLDGDNLKEIILTTSTNVHIYNGITYEPIWASPELDHPRDLNFADINLDGFIDFSVKDTTNIHLFDPLNDAVIWTSPAIDSTYKCYIIGDRNDDDWMDVAIVSKEWFTRELIEGNMDTVWVDLFDGPVFAEDDHFIILMLNFLISGGPGYYWASYEYPIDIIMEDISGTDGIFPRIVISTDFSSRAGAPGGFEWREHSGFIWMFDAEDYGIEQRSESGYIIQYEVIESDEDVYLHCLSGSYASGPYHNIYTDSIMIKSFSSDTILQTAVIWNTNENSGSAWNGALIEDLHGFEGLEICISSDDSVSLYRFPSAYHIWTVDQVAGLDTVLYSFTTLSGGGDPHIICQISEPLLAYELRHSADGSLTAVFPDFGYPISMVDDPDSDSVDVLFSLDNDMLYVHGAMRIISVDDTPIPGLPYLSANYPNPFNSSTTIEYSLPEPGEVTIEIFDLLGRRVETLIDTKQDAGVYRVTWDAEDQASGVYFYSIEADEFSDTKRMVYLK